MRAFLYRGHDIDRHDAGRCLAVGERAVGPGDYRYQHHRVVRFDHVRPAALHQDHADRRDGFAIGQRLDPLPQGPRKTSFGLAAKAGGEGRPPNIMFVFDTTGPMHVVGSTCTIPSRAKPTKIQCALYALQEVLKVMPKSVDKVGHRATMKDIASGNARFYSTASGSQGAHSAYAVGQ